MTLPRWLRWRGDRELDEEIDAHLEQEIRDNLDRGLALDQARSAALRRFGNRAQVMERAREGDPFFGLETVGRDVVYGLRSLRRNPAFAAVATLSLALGIRANTLILRGLDSTLLRPLPLPDPERLVILWNVPDQSRPDQLGTSSIPRYYAFRDRAQSFDSVAAF